MDNETRTRILKAAEKLETDSKKIGGDKDTATNHRHIAGILRKYTKSENWFKTMYPLAESDSLMHSAKAIIDSIESGSRV
ncbi:MAG TPA: hypothetical protein VLH19_00345 [Patescibacteria group bacterium]|nr:hypothetical protein [Patescibacteria group bacterium]